MKFPLRLVQHNWSLRKGPRVLDAVGAEVAFVSRRRNVAGSVSVFADRLHSALKYRVAEGIDRDNQPYFLFEDGRRNALGKLTRIGPASGLAEVWLGTVGGEARFTHATEETGWRIVGNDGSDAFRMTRTAIGLWTEECTIERLVEVEETVTACAVLSLLIRLWDQLSKD